MTLKNPHDPLSHVSAYLALLPQGLVLVYVVLIYTHREIEIALAFSGQLLCEALNWTLKRWIKQARPEAIRHLGKGYGMPSSHAQFMAYFAVTVTLFLLLRHSPSGKSILIDEDMVSSEDDAKTSALEPISLVTSNGSNHKRRPTKFMRKGGIVETVDVNDNSASKDLSDPLDEAPTISAIYRLQLHHPRLTHSLISTAVIVVAILVAVSRIYLHYHTPSQVLVGCVVGTIFAVAWFAFTEYTRRKGWINWILELQLVRQARVRDLLCEEDLVEIGWQVWEAKRRRRLSLLNKKLSGGQYSLDSDESDSDDTDAPVVVEALDLKKLR